MSQPQNTPSRTEARKGGHGRRSQRTVGLLAAISFGAYVLNIVSGKVSTMLGMQPPLCLGDIAELLLLLLAVTLFVATTLLAEAASGSSDVPCQAAESTPTSSPEPQG